MSALQILRERQRRIRYTEVGAGFPLLATPGGGLNSRISNWPNAVINIPEEFKNDFRCITMDQRNATDGESTGAGPGQRSLGRFRRRSARPDGPSRHPPVLFFGNCIGGLVRDEADGARAAARRRRRC